MLIKELTIFVPKKKKKLQFIYQEDLYTQQKLNSDYCDILFLTL
jgi:hypothetical protein